MAQVASPRVVSYLVQGDRSNSRKGTQVQGMPNHQEAQQQQEQQQQQHMVQPAHHSQQQLHEQAYLFRNQFDAQQQQQQQQQYQMHILQQQNLAQQQALMNLQSLHRRGDDSDRARFVPPNHQGMPTSSRTGPFNHPVGAHIMPSVHSLGHIYQNPMHAATSVSVSHLGQHSNQRKGLAGGSGRKASVFRCKRPACTCAFPSKAALRAHQKAFHTLEATETRERALHAELQQVEQNHAVLREYSNMLRKLLASAQVKVSRMINPFNLYGSRPKRLFRSSKGKVAGQSSGTSNDDDESSSPSTSTCTSNGEEPDIEDDDDDDFPANGAAFFPSKAHAASTKQQSRRGGGGCGLGGKRKPASISSANLALQAPSAADVHAAAALLRQATSPSPRIAQALLKRPRLDTILQK